MRGARSSSIIFRVRANTYHDEGGAVSDQLDELNVSHFLVVTTLYVMLHIFIRRNVLGYIAGIGHLTPKKRKKCDKHWAIVEKPKPYRGTRLHLPALAVTLREGMLAFRLVLPVVTARRPRPRTEAPLSNFFVSRAAAVAGSTSHMDILLGMAHTTS